MLGASKLSGLSRVLLARAGHNHVILKESRATYIKGFWPEPLTQTTIDQFLKDINYFDEPKQFINIGLVSSKTDQKPSVSDNKIGSSNRKPVVSIDVEEALDLLGEEVEPQPFDIDDASLDKTQLTQLAASSGIYRDLFCQYEPDREHIRFTPEQADCLYKLVPYHWITDQPFARVDRKRKDPDPLQYFEPVVRISARFVHSLEGSDQGDKYSHTSYHGNFIPAHEARVKPSICIDGSWLECHESSISPSRESRFTNWEPGHVTYENMPTQSANVYHSLLLLNLDSMHPNSANIHWMLANISRKDSQKEATFEEVCDFLPVHGMRGFGYSRYVFLALQHHSKLDTTNVKINDFTPATRKFDAKSFIQQNKNIGMVPVGLSWFQTVWDESSNDIFHNYMNMRSPVYEYVQDRLEQKKFTNMSYPGKIPFNVFMDHYRDPKEFEENVLLERLKNVDPFDYRDQYVKPKVPPTVFKDEIRQPTWMRTVTFKKKNRVGVYRGLRPASATLPLNNNVDLDFPLRPISSSRKSLPGFPNLYPAKPRIKRLKDLPYSKPANDHSNVYIQEGSEVFVDEVKKVMNSSETKKEE